jgi:hypothetical protein
LPETIRLDPKDPRILLAAIHGNADYLQTGDADTSSIFTESRLKPSWWFGRRSISSVGDGLENAGFALLFRLFY